MSEHEHEEGFSYDAYEIVNNDLEWKCPGCGEVQRIRGIGVVFRGEWLNLLEELAKRRHESVENFIVHLLWLEARLRKGALSEKADMVMFGHTHKGTRPNLRG